MRAADLIGRLHGVQGKGPRWRAVCPAHQSKHGTKSLSIYEPEPEHLLLHCHAGCDVESIVGALGLDLADLFPPRGDDHGGPKPAIRKPWRASDVLAALRHELHVAWVVLADVKAGAPINEDDKLRADVAMRRIGALIDELANAA